MYRYNEFSPCVIVERQCVILGIIFIWNLNWFWLPREWRWIRKEEFAQHFCTN